MDERLLTSYRDKPTEALLDMLILDPSGYTEQARQTAEAVLAERGTPLPDGDTVGRTNDERFPVHYVTSPVDLKKRVWRVEIR